MQYITTSEKETKKLAKKFAENTKSRVIALQGNLGAGKTTFVQGFAEGLGIKEKVISPTFVLIRQHQIPSTKKGFYHLDLYRLEDEKDFKSLGLKDIINENNLVLIEWGEKIKDFLPKTTTWVSIENMDKNQRKITIS